MEGSSMRLEMFLDYRSVYSYLACHRVRQWDTEIDYRVVDLARVMGALNNQPVPACPAKLRYSTLDVSRWAELYGVGFAPNMPMFEAMRSGQLEGALLSHAGLAAQQLGVFDTFNAAMFAALWAADDDIASEAGRSRFLEKHNLPVSLFELSSDPAIVERLSRHDDEAIERGVFGAPIFFVDGEMFFGNDRLPFVEARLTGERKPGAVI
jgi:2-hydroxychromene-2-carboxylate isomerase